MKTYTHTKPCKRGHYERYKATGVCVDCAKGYQNKFRKVNKAKTIDYQRKWLSNPVNMARRQAVWQMRIRDKRLGTKWDDVLTWIYLNRPKGYVVDHIEPIDGETSSGLHTPWNLQYLLHGENCNHKMSLTEYEAKSAITIDWEQYVNKPLP